MRVLSIIIFLFSIGIVAHASPYELAMEYIKNNDSICSSEKISENDGFYIFDHILLNQVPSWSPFYFYQNFKFRRDSLKLNYLPNLFRKDSIDRASRMSGRANYSIDELKDLLQKYKRKKNRWVVYFFEPEMYNQRIYLVVKMVSYSYSRSKQYDEQRIKWQDKEIILYFEFDINMQQMVDVWHWG